LLHYLQAESSEDGRAEALIAALEQCSVDLLREFYDALKAANQPQIEQMLREG